MVSAKEKELLSVAFSWKKNQRRQITFTATAHSLVDGNTYHKIAFLCKIMSLLLLFLSSNSLLKKSIDIFLTSYNKRELWLLWDKHIKSSHMWVFQTSTVKTKPLPINQRGLPSCYFVSTQSKITSYWPFESLLLDRGPKVLMSVLNPFSCGKHNSYSNS